MRLILSLSLLLTVAYAQAEDNSATTKPAATSSSAKASEDKSVSDKTSASVDKPAEIAASFEKWRPQTEISTSGTMMRFIQGLAVALGVFFIGIRAYKKFVLKDQVIAKRRLKIVERLSLGQKMSVVIVKLDDRQLLLSVTPESVGMLTEVTQNEETFTLDELCQDGASLRERAA